MSTIHWTEGPTHLSAHWHSENGTSLPQRTIVADDRMKADDAYRQARQGTALLWQGDFHNARQLQQAMSRRIDRKPPRSSSSRDNVSFHQHRRAGSHRARVLGMLLVLLDDDYTLALRRAPDVRQACLEAYGPSKGPMAISLRELLGVIGAHQWRLKGVDVPALGARIHPHYGVFAPVRGEYVDLVANTPLPPATRHSPATTAFDLGTGTGVLAAVLARRGINHVVATDISSRALACARENIHRLALTGRIDVPDPCLFPEGRADLIVCNPPWLPARPTGPIEQGVYDADSTMLHGFLAGLSAHLQPGGEGWLILSDLAEHLGLRTRGQLLGAIQAAHLRVAERIDTKPRHPRSKDTTDPLHAARSAETTSLWRLIPA